MVLVRGVTLTELLIVVAVLAILATAAYPNYKRIKQESRRADAHTSVIATEGIVERYLTENNKVNLDSTDMALDQFADYDPSSSTPVISNGGNYIITIVPNSTSYSINATASIPETNNTCGSSNLGQCADTACRIISMTDGEKQSTNSTGSVADATTTTCW
jgi:type IV pilus assembly protein PilE